MPPGTIIVPRFVWSDGRDFQTDPSLCELLGGATHDRLLGSDAIAQTRADKASLHRSTGGDAVDLESGAVANVAGHAGVPFAVLRAICDPADRDLPPAALAALDHRGVIGMWRVLGSVMRHPGQIPVLIGLARDASAARSALVRRIEDIRRTSGSDSDRR
jgi:adenosylhomocysteine nucleosidase